MEALEITQYIIIAVLTLAGALIPIMIRFGWIKGKTEELYRLQQAAQLAVAAAEEVGSREGMTGAQKLAYAKEAIQLGFPKLSDEDLELAINAALAISNFSSAVNKTKKNAQ